MNAIVNGGVSWWWEREGAPAPRPALQQSLDADVCIVGAGFTGLWTAYYVKKQQPDARVVVLEQRFAGFGASGRNGGWLTNSVTGGRGQYVKSHGRQAAIDQQRAMNAAVDEVIDVAAAEGIDADIRKGGELNVALLPAQAARLKASHAAESAWPCTDVQLWSAEETARSVNVDGVLAGLWHPHCASVDPVKLVKGLADAVQRLGVTIFEGTTVTEIVPGEARTAGGVVRAPFVIRATEGFTADLKGQHRTLLPLNSSMIVTEPLPAAFWDAVGWADGTTLGDFAHIYMYAQRTADDRIAFGGRGVPYRYGSRVDDDGKTQERTIGQLRALLDRFFPGAAGVPLAHAWAGVLGVSRDWAASVDVDRSTGLGWAGGYVGTGVTTTNLAGRTLADLIAGRDTDLTRLPWVGRRTRKWEIEPLRWLGVSAVYGAYAVADRREAGGQPNTAAAAKLAGLIAGR
ncbi:MAG TPA: FAD-binding oxidoreductase [Microbacterium sp.]|uniref:NAD(P)/FAD-dependent oxidoreductase n=1 Tax=Microbacterium sp. TaxID=51671 RepID=UPI002B89DF7A|nr:FAD-binding oxidoreductase [Microbacterium sp.]HWI30054.1 FAD-binding oxidoreductase [Microbacterium sp.]